MQKYFNSIQRFYLFSSFILENLLPILYSLYSIIAFFRLRHTCRLPTAYYFLALKKIKSFRFCTWRWCLRLSKMEVTHQQRCCQRWLRGQPACPQATIL
ncbi:unnamed protein product [Leptidea sinapis]|uniref:Uncharacterized protein n=1 Tax=Leptidea sinapis TaxID=189913 RepID=A0A5E4PP53_9NEOP|nr:unnamed protein product [Leptidea sinapis]